MELYFKNNEQQTAFMNLMRYAQTELANDVMNGTKEFSELSKLLHTLGDTYKGKWEILK